MNERSRAKPEGYSAESARKKALLGFLILANLAALAAAVLIASGGGHAQGGGLKVSDLVYGKIDVDGDGQYAFGDDFWVYTAIERWPEALEKALRQAKMRDDGGVDLSPYLRSVNHLTIEAAKRAGASER
ncbi:MAG: hypothetical protein ACUVYA_16360 [Planctomycetota bacterium]